MVNKKQGLISRFIPLLLPSACLPGTAPVCLPQFTLLLLPPSPQPQGLSEQGVASPTSQALSVYLDPALLSSQLLLFHQLVTSSFSCRLLFPLGQAHSVWAANIFFSSSIKPQLSQETGSSLSPSWSLWVISTSAPSPEHPWKTNLPWLGVLEAVSHAEGTVPSQSLEQFEQDQRKVSSWKLCCENRSLHPTRINCILLPRNEKKRHEELVRFITGQKKCSSAAGTSHCVKTWQHQICLFCHQEFQCW